MLYLLMLCYISFGYDQELHYRLSPQTMPFPLQGRRRLLFTYTEMLGEASPKRQYRIVKSSRLIASDGAM